MCVCVCVCVCMYYHYEYTSYKYQNHYNKIFFIQKFEKLDLWIIMNCLYQLCCDKILCSFKYKLSIIFYETKNFMKYKIIVINCRDSYYLFIN